VWGVFHNGLLLQDASRIQGLSSKATHVTGFSPWGLEKFGDCGFRGARFFSSLQTPSVLHQELLGAQEENS
jgi:hypothetical protein